MDRRIGIPCMDLRQHNLGRNIGRMSHNGRPHANLVAGLALVADVDV